MRPNVCLTILCVSIFAALVLTLDADDEDSDCYIVVKVHYNTVYEAVVGEDLRINCTVEFCRDPPPPVSWYRRGTTDVPVNGSSHIKTEWKPLKPLVGTGFLIFQKVGRNDSGVYQCQSGGSVGHNINVSVHGVGERTNVTRNNDTWELTTVPSVTIKSVTEDSSMLSYIRATVVGVTILIAFIASCYGCKDKAKDTSSRKSSQDASPSTHENDQ